MGRFDAGIIGENVDAHQRTGRGDDLIVIENQGIGIAAEQIVNTIDPLDEHADGKHQHNPSENRDHLVVFKQGPSPQFHACALADTSHLTP